jgi:hypothetical protein
MKGGATTNCKFCQVQVGNRRPASLMDESLLSSPSPLPPINPRLHRPSRIRIRPRHFDSSPDLDVSRRCEKRAHFPLKMVRDFIDPQGKMHAICNECRQNNQRHPVSPSSEEDENRTHQPILPSLDIPARRPLQDVTAHHINRLSSINRSLPDIPRRFYLFYLP